MLESTKHYSHIGNKLLSKNLIINYKIIEINNVLIILEFNKIKLSCNAACL